MTEALRRSDRQAACRCVVASSGCGACRWDPLISNGTGVRGFDRASAGPTMPGADRISGARRSSRERVRVAGHARRRDTSGATRTNSRAAASSSSVGGFMVERAPGRVVEVGRSEVAKALDQAARGALRVRISTARYPAATTS